MIRNFIYLDSDKLRSASSQMFEGVTEQVISTTSDSDLTSEEQKGPIGSGRLLGEIFAKERASSELKFMEDHAYTLFEGKLIADKLVDEMDAKAASNPPSKSFVKVSARLRLNDMAASQAMLENFNEIGEAFWRVTHENMNPTLNDKVLPDSEVRKRAAQEGLQMHKKVSDAAAVLMKFGYQGVLEAHMQIDGRLFSAPLKREFLRENEQMLIHKYSRVTSRSFSMVGIVTQRGDEAVQEEILPDVKDADSPKEAMRTLALHIRSMEEAFVAPSANEIVIDPIAIYSVL